MNNSNPFLIAIEDEFIKGLESGLEPHRDLVVDLQDHEFFRILEHGIYSKGKRLDLATMVFALKIAGHKIVVKSEYDAEPRVEH